MSLWTRDSGLRSLFARFASFTVLGILGALVYFGTSPAAGQAQLDRTMAALKNVHSWRRRSEVRVPASPAQISIDESSCPSANRHTIIIEATETSPRTQLDSVRIGTNYYDRTNDNPWSVRNSGPGYGDCTDASRTIEVGALPLRVIREVGEITKGEKRLVDGVKCRDWRFRTAAPDRMSVDYTMCIDSDDLPREIRTADGHMVVAFSDWNANVQISAPEIAPVTAASSNSIIGNQ